MVKWRLVIKTLPWVAFVLAITLLRQYGLHMPSLFDFGDIGAVLTAAALVVGLMLAGVIGDYKESEQLPGEVATALQGFDDAIIAGTRVGEGLDVRQFRRRYADIVTVVVDWFMNRAPIGASVQALNRANDLVVDLDRAGMGAVYVSQCLSELRGLRKLVTRIDVIRRTRFIQTAYALQQMFVFATIVLLVFSEFRNWQVQVLIVGTLTLIYVYLLRLIRDLDDPFEYAGGYIEGATADVSPHPVLEYHERLKASLAS